MKHTITSTIRKSQNNMIYANAYISRDTTLRRGDYVTVLLSRSDYDQFALDTSHEKFTEAMELLKEVPMMDKKEVDENLDKRKRYYNVLNSIKTDSSISEQEAKTIADRIVNNKYQSDVDPQKAKDNDLLLRCMAKPQDQLNLVDQSENVEQAKF